MSDSYNRDTFTPNQNKVIAKLLLSELQGCYLSNWGEWEFTLPKSPIFSLTIVPRFPKFRARDLNLERPPYEIYFRGIKISSPFKNDCPDTVFRILKIFIEESDYLSRMALPDYMQFLKRLNAVSEQQS